MQHVVTFPKNMTPLELYLGTLRCYPAFYAGQSPWKQLRRLLPHWPRPVLAALAVSWPWRATGSGRARWSPTWTTSALRRLEADPRGGFPQLSAQGLALGFLERPGARTRDLFAPGGPARRRADGGMSRSLARTKRGMPARSAIDVTVSTPYDGRPPPKRSHEEPAEPGPPTRNARP